MTRLEAGSVDQDNVAFTDDELTELALAADPDPSVADGPVPLSEFRGSTERSQGADLLPGWYIPPRMGTGRLLEGWRCGIVLLIVVSFVKINAMELCSTYGHVGFD